MSYLVNNDNKKFSMGDRSSDPGDRRLVPPEAEEQGVREDRGRDRLPDATEHSWKK